MANVKISELTAATTLAATDELEINAAGTSKKATAQKLLDLTTGTANTFTAAQTFRAANAIRTEAASTQDAVVVAGRAGGTASYAVTMTPTTLSANRTLTLPDANGTVLTTAAAVTVAQGGTGQTSYTDGQLLIGNSTGNTLTKATLTAGTGITVTNGSGSITIAASGSSGAKAADRQVFTASGTWTKPSGFGSKAVALLEAWGGGGGGYNSGGVLTGGGGGGYSYKWVLLSALAATVSITVGSGGDSGVNGGNSIINGHLTAYGGAGGSSTEGGGGGGQISAGSGRYSGRPSYIESTTAEGTGGLIGGTYPANYGVDAYFKGGGGSTGGANGGASVWGGGGGAGGGTAGTSVYGGAGGNVSVAASAPGGGGSANVSAGNRVGARGEVRITVFDGA